MFGRLCYMKLSDDLSRIPLSRDTLFALTTGAWRAMLPLLELLLAKVETNIHFQRVRTVFLQR